LQIAVSEGEPVDLTLRIGQPHAAPVASPSPDLAYPTQRQRSRSHGSIGGRLCAQRTLPIG
jgi:hypothetical protein